jgi:hypothetical protein
VLGIKQAMVKPVCRILSCPALNQVTVQAEFAGRVSFWTILEKEATGPRIGHFIPMQKLLKITNLFCFHYTLKDSSDTVKKLCGLCRTAPCVKPNPAV